MEENIEFYKEENEKLQNRLKKAVEVFKEQKDDLVRLTGEKEDLAASVREKDRRIEELEERLKEKSEDDTKFFEMIDELENTKTKCTNLESDITSKEEEIRKLNDELSAARTSIESVMNNMTQLKESIFTNVDEILSNANDILSVIDKEKPSKKRK